MTILTRAQVEDMRRAYAESGDAEVVRLCATVRALRKLIDDDLDCAQAEECHRSCPTCEVHLRMEEMLK